MGFSSGAKYKAKETERGIRDEVRTLDSSTKRGVSQVDIDKGKSNERNNLLKDPTVKEQLMNFLFGDASNPFEEITKKYQTKKDNLNKKGYQLSNIVTIRKERDE